MTRTLTIFILIMLCGASLGGAWASGGVYLADFKVMNNGATVFSDSFGPGKVVGWTKPYDVTIVDLARRPMQPSPAWYANKEPTRALYMNKQHTKASALYHTLNIKNAGVVELSTAVCVTPNSEQYECARNKPAVLQITMYSGNTSGTLRASVYAAPNAEGCKIGITLDRLGCGYLVPQILVHPWQWAVLTMRMDPNQREATVLIDGNPAKSIPYDPLKFKSIRLVGIETSFGEGAFRTD